MDMSVCNEEPMNVYPAPPAAPVTAAESQRPSPLSEPSSDGLLGGGDFSLESEKYRFQELVWGPESLSWVPAVGAGVMLEEWAVEVPGSDQFDASFVDQWWEDAVM